MFQLASRKARYAFSARGWAKSRVVTPIEIISYHR